MRLPIATLLLTLGLSAGAAAAELPLDKIKLPPGFSIAVYAADVPNARSMVRSEKGTLFVGTREKEVVYAVTDADGDHVAEQVRVVATGLKMPNGVALKDGALYIAALNQIVRLDDIENRLDAPPAPVVVYDQLPTDEWHGWKYLALGPDGYLYFNVGAPCNICDAAVDRDPLFSTISRIKPDGTGLEAYAHGVRNSVGFTWHPTAKDLWFTDNGRDMLGDDRPPCELNRSTAPGQHFGFPYCHGGDDPDPEFGSKRPCGEFVPPVQKLGAHVAGLGVKFYTGAQFPEAYRNQVLIAEHGSWNRSVPIGYRVMMVKLNAEGAATAYEPFAEGWLQRTKSWGRPVDLLVMPDGALLVSDDQAGVIYRIAYTG